MFTCSFDPEYYVFSRKISADNYFKITPFGSFSDPLFILFLVFFLLFPFLIIIIRSVFLFLSYFIFIFIFILISLKKNIIKKCPGS